MYLKIEYFEADIKKEETEEYFKEDIKQEWRDDSTDGLLLKKEYFEPDVKEE